MIKISLDEGYVFDILSINQVKLSKSGASNVARLTETFERLKEEIISQIGEQQFQAVVSSEVYRELTVANAETFDLVDLARQSDGLARQVDISNYNRYLKKVELQKRFFNSEVKEVKIGYDPGSAVPLGTHSLKR